MRESSTRERVALRIGVAVIVVILVWVLLRYPWAALVVAMFVVCMWHSHRQRQAHLRQLVVTRVGEDIGTFSHALDRRRQPFDPKVVRAVWDALHSQLVVDASPVPIRPIDRLIEDLQLDWEDLDFDVADEIAPRAGRSLNDVKRNPRFGRVQTVADLVHLLSSQPQATQHTPEEM